MKKFDYKTRMWTEEVYTEPKPKKRTAKMKMTPTNEKEEQDAISKQERDEHADNTAAE
jgi:hypothetical protein